MTTTALTPWVCPNSAVASEPRGIGPGDGPGRMCGAGVGGLRRQERHHQHGERPRGVGALRSGQRGRAAGDRGSQRAPRRCAETDWHGEEYRQRRYRPSVAVGTQRHRRILETELAGRGQKPFKEVSAFVSYDSTDPSSPIVCRSRTYKVVNASYNYGCNIVSWDRGELFPAAKKYFGDMSVVGILAHEFGHSLQFNGDWSIRRRPRPWSRSNRRIVSPGCICAGLPRVTRRVSP